MHPNPLRLRRRGFFSPGLLSVAEVSAGDLFITNLFVETKYRLRNMAWQSVFVDRKGYRKTDCFVSHNDIFPNAV